jgi:hypothetical protein
MTVVEELLARYKCPQQYLGYDYLIRILKLCVPCADFAINMKPIYAVLAENSNTTRLAIEKNLTTLFTVWKKTCKEEFDDLFGKAKMTNAALIIKLVNCIKNYYNYDATLYELIFN